MKLSLDPRVAELLVPVRPVLDRAERQLPEGPEVEVTIADIDGLEARHGRILVLSGGFAGPDVQHPNEPVGALPPMDRWRRALIGILEFACTHAIAYSTDLDPEDDWRWVGLAMEMVDIVAPELQCGQEGLALAYSTGSPGRFPRAGVAVMKAARADGHDPWHYGRNIIDGGVISEAEWLAYGAWVFREVPGLLPVPVPRVGAVDIPVAIDAWRWQPIAVPPHRRGGRIDTEGSGAVSEAWARAGRPHRAIAASLGGNLQLLAHSGGPVGEWTVTSAEGFGQIMGARGVSFRFTASGRIEMVFADAFVGPLAAVAMSEEVGTSGVATGRWAVAGPYSLRFSKLDDSQLTMHGRTRGAFKMPARGFGIAAWLQALESDPWAWQVNADRLVLRGQMLGGWVDVRLKRA